MAIFCWINNPQIAEIIVGKKKKLLWLIIRVQISYILIITVSVLAWNLGLVHFAPFFLYVFK